MWGSLNSWCCFRPKAFQKQPHLKSESLPLIAQRTQNDNVCATATGVCFSAVATMLTSWLHFRRWRYLLLILCSPFLLPLLCVAFPFFCAVEICYFMCRRRRSAAEQGRRRLEEGGDEVGLLQRYLQDQLMLVVGSECEGGGIDGENGEIDGVGVEYFDSLRTVLQ